MSVQIKGFPNSDIREVLKQRLEEARSLRQRLVAELREAEAAEQGYMRALEAENRRFQPEEPKEPAPAPSRQLASLFSPVPTTTKDFLFKVLSDGRERSLDQLKVLAELENLSVPKGASIGRMLHGALLGLKVSDQVEMPAKGVWRIKK